MERLEGRVAPAVFVVTNLNDSGDGSLRQAIVQSNSTAGPNEIDFASGLSGTIMLTSGQLTIANNDVKLVGPGADVIAVSGNNATRVFEVDAVQAAISGLTVTSGRIGSASSISSANGGGLLNNGGAVRIADCTISGNSTTNVTGLGGGGGIYNSGGTMTIAGCTINGNTSTGNGVGGGLYNNAGTVTVTASTLSGNSSTGAGGGIDNTGGTMTIADSTFLDNSSTGSTGGGISSIGTLTVGCPVCAHFVHYTSCRNRVPPRRGFRVEVQ
jgi:hypothetical protein